jgi:TonB family protein
MRYFAALLICVLIGAVPCVKAQQDPLDAAASEAAAAIAKAAGKHSSDAQVLVADFSETKGHPTALGPDLTRQFSLSLQAHAKNFTLSDRDQVLRQLAADKLPAESYANPNTLKCYSPAQVAEFVVTGEMNDMPDAIVIAIKAFRIKGSQVIFDKQVSLDLTPAMRQLLKQDPYAIASPNSDHAATDRSNHTRAPGGGANGNSMPACVYCPSPSFSDAARKKKYQGVVVAQVRIDVDGRVAEVSIVRGLPCGLNKEAIATLYQWKFRPATDRDGQPLEVTVPVEVSFRLY